MMLLRHLYLANENLAKD